MAQIYDKNDVLVYVDSLGGLRFLLIVNVDEEEFPFITYEVKELKYEEATSNTNYKLKVTENLPYSYRWLKK